MRCKRTTAKILKSRSAPVRQRLAEIVEQGTPVSQGMAEFPRVFPTYVRNIVQVAERSGSLSENLIQLREYLEWMDKNWKSFKQALLYPMCVVWLWSLSFLSLCALSFRR